MIFTTSICSNYLPKAIALAESVKKHMPSSTFVLCLVEKQIPEQALQLKCFDKIILSHELFEKEFDFNSFIFSHSIVEASTAVKGDLFKHLMKINPNVSEFIYLDPDTFVFSPFEELIAALKVNDIIVTPHLLYPGNIDMEISSLKHGVFNLGFLAVKRSAESSEFVQWWADRLRMFCYEDFMKGLFTDQKWINLAPCFYNTHILKEPGYNYATWTIKTRRMTKSNDNYLVNSKPLRFLHFSGYDSGTFDKAIGWWSKDETEANVLKELSKMYIAKTNSSENAHFSKIPWSYALNSGNQKVLNQTRVQWREIKFHYKHLNPFNLTARQIKGFYSKQFSVKQKIKNLVKKFIRA
jgi:hypothetical protein